MSHCFSFRFFEPDDRQRKSLAIFTEAKVSLDEISRILKHDVTENLVPKNVYLITTSQDGYTRQGCRDDAAFISEFESYVGEIDGRLRCLVSSSSGIFSYCDGQVVEDELSARHSAEWNANAVQKA